MKYGTLLLCMLLSAACFAQCKDYVIGVKGDTLNCQDMKGRKQGRWVVKVDELRGERGYEEEGVYLNSKKEGTWRRYSTEGDILAIENYRWGNKDGKSIYFTNVGDPLREESWKAVNPDNPYDTVPVHDVNDPSKIIGTEIVKLEGFSLKHGTWKYYDAMSGKIEKTESWFLDKPATRTGDGENDLAPIAVTDGDADAAPQAKKTTAKPREVLEFEKKNSGKKKVRMRDGSTGG